MEEVEVEAEVEVEEEEDGLEVVVVVVELELEVVELVVLPSPPHVVEHPVAVEVFEHSFPASNSALQDAIRLLLVIQYLHTDDIAAIWDLRVSNPTKAAWKPLGVNPLSVKQELLAPPQLLKLPRLIKALEGVLKIATQPQLEADIRALYLRACQHC
ncbi:hypothetical protein FRC04_001210 [Tulasnella sp. 424]|nr:hypothetical protein FRC04_001210 [Tulasnella sp. 424]KAG8975770.1 hypothetical protein FRC05_004980 [Tulasnella sp. 425]